MLNSRDQLLHVPATTTYFATSLSNMPSLPIPEPLFGSVDRSPTLDNYVTDVWLRKALLRKFGLKMTDSKT